MRSRIVLPENELGDFCRRNHIKQLSFFGSVLRDDFTPQSDLDVLVEFFADARITMFDLVRMQDELRLLSGREVDLLERRVVEQSENYIRRKSILDSLETIYAA